MHEIAKLIEGTSCRSAKNKLFLSSVSPNQGTSSASETGSKGLDPWNVRHDLKIGQVGMFVALGSESSMLGP